MIQLKQFTKEHLEKWKQDGCLYLPREELYNSEIKQNLIDWVNEVQNLPEEKGKWMKYYEKSLKDGSRILNRVENFLPYHEKLNNLLNGEWMLRLVSQLFEEPATLFKDKINFKLPGGEGFKPHQDAQAGWDGYGQTLHISVAVCIDEATPANGCLECVLGEHKKGLQGPMFKELPQEVVEKWDWVSFKMKPGDIIIFDSYTPHRSGPNLTDTTRRMVFLTFSKRSEGDYRAKYFEDKRKTFPPDIERKPGVNYSYKI
ncbi:phytanoyl-CoA dioxygenase family protein [Halalkalibacter alkaliphilus]|uniref:Phytanoyl-CoA dioxygenase family protein n=1 Tax=Halalkalibacter alkaliphilus TaxID=2917993 RepID=A0A9X2I9C9_9BACI|nr:phytanoyl-CoA dioxygenase family protein [Halalkalibacter alkaliphilus]MCL7748675.1 phytanoyl-CoA dioxygenase family protein [Halalkalibacter alkaliphilus]